MAKQRSQFVCQQCGYSQISWAGKCPSCASWNSMVETSFRESENQSSGSKSKTSRPIPLSSINKKILVRIQTNISELDRALGGGMVPGQVILIAGEPGIGKSTILLQLADKIEKTLYVSGEESIHQIAVRADRLGVKNKMNILETNDIDNVISNAMDEKPNLLIVDSIQTMNTSDLTGMAGSVGQVRECAFRLTRFAKSTNTPTIIVGHVTKEGSVAGPSVLAHIVDTILWFEGDKKTNIRILRTHKNRFGATDETGIFEMNDKGLESITDSEKIFLSTGTKSVPGSVISVILQGIRPILLEIQALVVPNKSGFTKRIAQGITPTRLELLIAVLTKRTGLPLYETDVFINITGGIRVEDPGIDLAICLAIASSYKEKAIPAKTVAIGEVGLLGDIRPTLSQERRIKEAKRLGFKNIISNSTYSYLYEAIKKSIQ